MDRNIVMLIGAVLVIIMVMFGRNPIQEAREAKAKKGDPFIQAIKEHNAKDREEKAGMMFQGDAMQQNPNYNYPTYQNIYQQPQYMVARPSQNGQNSKPDTSGGGYYPPPPPPPPQSQPR